MSRARLARRKGFQALHRYARANWTEEQNRAEFGACFTPNGHGHNYELEVFIEGPIQPDTGMIVNLVDVDRWITEVVQLVDGKTLNTDLAYFEERVPTTEALAAFLYEQLAQTLPFKSVQLAKMRLYECDDLWVDIWP